MADQLDLFIFSCRAKDCGMTWTTNRNKAPVRGWSVSSQSWHMSAILVVSHCGYTFGV